MSVLPIVNPAHNADGIPLLPVITAIYPFALDEGSVAITNCFLVRKTTVLGANKTTPVSIKVSTENLELVTTNNSTIVDYGDDVFAGAKFRTKIILSPTIPLDQHAEYSVILSKDLAKNSVFAVKPGIGNVGSLAPLAKGPYLGLVSNTYTIQVLVGGNENTATYKATRASDGTVLTGLIAKKRYIELERGLFLKFNTGTYVTGDTFTINVKPLVKINEIYSWDFNTGDSSYIQPSDENSTVIVGLPVETNTVTIPTPNLDFRLVSVTPAFNSVMNKPGKKAMATIQGIKFSSKYRTTEFNGKKIKFIIDDNMAPLSSIIYANDIEITIRTETLKKNVISSINAGPHLIASSLVGDEFLVEDTQGVILENGENGGEVIFTFTKDIKASSFTKEKINILAESTAATYYGTIDFEHKITNNKLIINFL